MVRVAKMPAMLWLLAAVFTLGAAVARAQDNYYDFFVKETNYTKLCEQKTLLTVNGQWPGPTITARKGENVTVNVHNQGPKNITIHWHGVDQPRNPWYDGPEFITQCPIRPGTNFTYTIILSEEEGTLWWHAHSDLDRAGVHGALMVHPKKSNDYPFKKPNEEIPIILGEWWKTDLNFHSTMVLEEYIRVGSEFNISNAHTINGQPGDLYPCSKNDTFKLSVQTGKTYLLRIINAGLDNDMYFSVAGHMLTVVGTDGRYLKPFTVKTIMISPGQTMDALLEASRSAKGSPNGRFYMASRTFASNPAHSYHNGTATAILEYTDAPSATRVAPPDFPTDLPASNVSDVAIAYTAQLRSLATKDHPVNVPTHVDEEMLITLAVNAIPCNGTCTGAGGNRLGASLNNASFEDPHIDILDAYYYSIPGVYDPDFPNKPPFFFNFTDATVSNGLRFTKRGTRVKVVEYGAVVEVVFQDTAIFGAENHPMHLHGFAFYVVGRGLGNFNETTDPATYNLVDPPYQNTVTVPKAGWAAMRFHATNPGVWFMHCHFDRHTVFGMSTAFIVKEGKTEESKMRPRPKTMPVC
ncbi:unnamed protein product [Alopecurus aequalis]